MVGPFAEFLNPEGAYMSVVHYHDGNEQGEEAITDT